MRLQIIHSFTFYYFSRVFVARCRMTPNGTRSTYDNNNAYWPGENEGFFSCINYAYKNITTCYDNVLTKTPFSGRADLLGINDRAGYYATVVQLLYPQHYHYQYYCYNYYCSELLVAAYRYIYPYINVGRSDHVQRTMHTRGRFPLFPPGEISL